MIAEDSEGDSIPFFFCQDLLGILVPVVACSKDPSERLFVYLDIQESLKPVIETFVSAQKHLRSMLYKEKQALVHAVRRCKQ